MRVYPASSVVPETFSPPIGAVFDPSEITFTAVFGFEFGVFTTVEVVVELLKCERKSRRASLLFINVVILLRVRVVEEVPTIGLETFTGRVTRSIGRPQTAL